MLLALTVGCAVALLQPIGQRSLQQAHAAAAPPCIAATPQPRHAATACVAEPPVREAEPATASVDDTPALFRTIERSLEAVTGNPQLLLEAVVGIDKGLARYDRDGIMDYFKSRPQLMVGRALDFLLAFRRIRAAWTAEGTEASERGVVLRSELSALGPVAVKVGQTLSQRPDILP